MCFTLRGGLTQAFDPTHAVLISCLLLLEVDVERADFDHHWMRHALELAERAEREHDEIPVGAVLIDAEGRIVGEGWNRNIGDHDPSAHAEIVAMRAGGKALGNHRLIGCTLYVTLEPCAMCAMAMVHARVARLVYAASDPKTGAAGSVFDLIADPRHNHRVEVQGGVLADDASAMLTNYFRRKRGKAPILQTPTGDPHP
jgi:tRNA(adenine34) deaminase